MAVPFLKVKHNISVGDSKLLKNDEKLVPGILKKAKEKNVKIHIPVDFKCGDSFKEDCDVKTFDLKSGIPDGWMKLDIGPKTGKYY